MTLAVLAPLAGLVTAMSEVPDPVFAQSLVGPGVAVTPGDDATTAVAPITGQLVTLHPHAFVIVEAEGAGVLVHLGIDTVKLAGSGFTLLATEAQQVAAGDPIVQWDPVAIRAAGYSAVVPVVALDAGPAALEDMAVSGHVLGGDVLFRWRT